MTTPIQQAPRHHPNFPGKAHVLPRPQQPAPKPIAAPPTPCPYCHGAGVYIGGDEWHTCWCVREAAQEREDDKARAIERVLEGMP